MEPVEKIHRGRKKMIVDNFIGGISWGLGATLGVSFIIAIYGLVLSKINLIPILGDIVIGVNNFVLQNNPHLLK